LNNIVPEYLILVCDFTYSSQGKTRYIPNEIRRFLMGIIHQAYDKKKRPGLPEKISTELKADVLLPLYFSLIKYPTKESRAALGAIAIYQVITADMDIFKKACSIIRRELRKKNFNEFRLIAGRGMGHE